MGISDWLSVHCQAAFFLCSFTPNGHYKTCMQGDVARKKYKGIVQTGQLLTQEYGVAQGLFKGLMWRIALIATTFFLVNKIKETVAPVMFPSKRRGRKVKLGGVASIV